MGVFMKIKCLECEIEFDKKVHNQKFCSKECKRKYNNRKNRDLFISQRKYPNGFGFTNCKECGTKFEKSSAISKYCSANCRNKYHRRLHKAKKDSIYMQDIEEIVYDLVDRGYKAKMNNISTIYKYGMITTSLRDRISCRDNYSCKICGVGTNLEIHHIVKLIHGGDNKPNNLITLCKSCHRAIDTLDYNHAVSKCGSNFIKNFNNKRITNKNVNDILDECYKKILRLYDSVNENSIDNTELIKNIDCILDLIENNKTD